MSSTFLYDFVFKSFHNTSHFGGKIEKKILLQKMMNCFELFALNENKVIKNEDLFPQMKLQLLNLFSFACIDTDEINAPNFRC